MQERHTMEDEDGASEPRQGKTNRRKKDGRMIEGNKHFHSLLHNLHYILLLLKFFFG